MANRAREIVTRFTLEGLATARTGLQRLGSSITSFARSARQRLNNLFGPAIRGAARLSRAIGRVSFRGLAAGAKMAFVGGLVGLTAFIAKMVTLSNLVRSTAEETANLFDQISKDSRRLGVKEEDLSVIRFAAEREGVDPNAILPALARIGTQFSMVTEKIAEADAEYQKTKKWTMKQAVEAWKTGDTATANSLMAELNTSRMASRQGVADRIRDVREILENLNSGGRLFNAAQNSGMSQVQTSDYIKSMRSKHEAELRQLERDQKALEDAMGPAAKTLFDLEKQGLDVEAALKGDIVAFGKLGDAINKIQDPGERLKLASSLFGEDQGARFLTLLEAGTKGLEVYRKEAERLGIVVSKEDAELGASYNDSLTNRQQAFQGLKNEISREVLPLMQETNEKITAYIIKNKDALTKYAVDSYRSLRSFVFDVFKWINGEGDFESAFFKKIEPVISTLRDKIKPVLKTISQELSLLWNGEDSNFVWINKLVDGLGNIKNLAFDLIDMLAGKDATHFPWLNALRDALSDIGGKIEALKNSFAGKLISKAFGLSSSEIQVPADESEAARMRIQDMALGDSLSQAEADARQIGNASFDEMLANNPAKMQAYMSNLAAMNLSPEKLASLMPKDATTGQPLQEVVINFNKDGQQLTARAQSNDKNFVDTLNAASRAGY